MTMMKKKRQLIRVVQRRFSCITNSEASTTQLNPKKYKIIVVSTPIYAQRSQCDVKPSSPFTFGNEHEYEAEDEIDDYDGEISVNVRENNQDIHEYNDDDDDDSCDNSW